MKMKITSLVFNYARRLAKNIGVETEKKFLNTLVLFESPSDPLLHPAFGIRCRKNVQPRAHVLSRQSEKSSNTLTAAMDARRKNNINWHKVYRSCIRTNSSSMFFIAPSSFFCSLFSHSGRESDDTSTEIRRKGNDELITH